MAKAGPGHHFVRTAEAWRGARPPSWEAPTADSYVGQVLGYKCCMA